MHKLYNAQACKHATRPPFRHCKHQRSNLINLKYKWISASLLLLAMTISFSVHAKDKASNETLESILAETALPEGAYRYAPETCEFELTLPGKPSTTKRCAKNNKDCTTLTSYMMVYDVTTTVEISVTCVPSTPEQYDSYNEEVIRLALKGMTRKENMGEHQINTTEEDGVRQGSLLASTKRGLQNALYNAQLMVGQNSILTLEARLIGPSHAQADQVFGDILSSVKKTTAKQND